MAESSTARRCRARPTLVDRAVQLADGPGDSRYDALEDGPLQVSATWWRLSVHVVPAHGRPVVCCVSDVC